MASEKVNQEVYDIVGEINDWNINKLICPKRSKNKIQGGEKGSYLISSADVYFTE